MNEINYSERNLAKLKMKDYTTDQSASLREEIKKTLEDRISLRLVDKENKYCENSYITTRDLYILKCSTHQNSKDNFFT